MVPDPRERIVVRRLRAITLAVFVLGAAVIAISRVPVTILSDSGPRPEHPDVNGMLIVYVAVLVLPGLAVALRPRWSGIALWAMWPVPVSLFALFVTHIGEPPRDHPHPDPAWPGTAILWLLLAIHAGIMVVVPVVRGTHAIRSGREPPVPVARVHSR